MKNLFIPYPLAVLAKEKGFDEPCIAYHLYDGINKEFENKISNFVLHYKAGKNNTEYSKSKHIAAPLYQQIVDWFREKHGINFIINPEIENSNIIYSVSMLKVTSRNIGHGVNETYKTALGFIIDSTANKALSKAIEEALKLI